MRLNLKKKLNWHIWPEKDTIQSVYEIVFLFFILGLCFYAYTEMNSVRTISYDIDVACLYSHDSIQKYTLKYEPSVRANIEIKAPMTRNEDFTKKFWSDSSNITINFVPTVFYFPLQDRLNSWGENRYEEAKQDYDFLCPDSLKDLNNEYLCYAKVVRHDIGNNISFLRYNPFYDIYGWDGRNNLRRHQEIDTLKGYKENKTFKIQYSTYSRDSLAMISYFSTNSKVKGYADFNIACGIPKVAVWFLPWKQYVNTMISVPSWFTLEDISQQYYKIKLNSEKIDSISLRIDFCGVTEFSHISPEPDEKGMSYIVFSDTKKINRILCNGLEFHAGFKELSNMQQIRLFLLTSIMAGIVIIIVVFFIIGFYKFFRLFKPIEQKKQYFFIIFKIIFGFVVYTFLYWYVVLIAFPNLSGILYNMITIPLTLLILWIIFETKWEKKICYIIRDKILKKNKSGIKEKK